MMEQRRTKEQDILARGKTWKRVIHSPLLILAWFFPYGKARAWLHKLRGINIGKNVEIGYLCMIGHTCPELITIEDDVVITAKTTILEHDNAMYYTGRGEINYGPVVIKKNAFIGIGTLIMPNIIVGERSVIAPHSFVNKNVPANVLVGGCPAKIIKEYDSQ